jgi:hypothetical protein
MDEVFEIELPLINRKATVKKAPFYLTIVRDNLSSVTVDRLPLVEYFVFFDHAKKAEQIKAKVFKTEDGRWYDTSHSEDVDSYSPEFGIPEINVEIKKAIDAYEATRKGKASSVPA